MSKLYRAAITAQSSQAGTAATRVTAGQTEVKASPAGNADGANELIVTLDVTVAPASDGYVDLYIEEGKATGVYSAPRRVGRFLNVLSAGADTYTLHLYDVPEFSVLSWTPSVNMTATMYAVPAYYG